MSGIEPGSAADRAGLKRGDVIKSFNGKVVQDIDFSKHDVMRDRLKKGFICLTDHANWVSYRNLRLKKL